MFLDGFKVDVIDISNVKPAIFAFGLKNGYFPDTKFWDFDKSNSTYYEIENMLFDLSKNEMDEDLRLDEVMKYEYGIYEFFKFINITLDIKAPLYWWKKFNICIDQRNPKIEEDLKIIIRSRELSREKDFMSPICQKSLDMINENIRKYNEFEGTPEEKNAFFYSNILNILPSGFLSRRIVTINLKNLKDLWTIYKNNKYIDWIKFFESIISHFTMNRPYGYHLILWVFGKYGEKYLPSVTPIEMRPIKWDGFVFVKDNMSTFNGEGV